MKIFERNNKINFVDENNVLVGFDYSQCCCESFGYLFTGGEPTNTNQKGLQPDQDFTPAAYRFDTFYFRQSENGESSMATFKLFKSHSDPIRKGPEYIYLTLHNTHNGYYSHGFSMMEPKSPCSKLSKKTTLITVREGSL